jgi:hypothetical protein
MKQFFYTLLFLFTGSVLLQAQNTVGLLSYRPSEAYDGYNLIYPHNQPNVYLLDNCGEIVHVWEDEPQFRPGNTAYLLEDGRLVKTKRLGSVTQDAIWAGGGGAIVEIRSWDNDLLWSYELNNDTARLHHDIALTEEGTIIMLAWELKTAEEAIQAGRNPDLLVEGELWPDYLFEVDPATDEIVWEWHAWDHLIQDFDSTKDNFGVVEDNPGRIDINYTFQDGVADWMHSNALDYEDINDQIILSVPTFHEVWVIDKTTTTEEAAGDIGGFSGIGGNLMFRWGNPRAYRRGTEADQKLFYQHDIHWIDDFVDASLPEFGKLAVFNNRVGENFSTANIITPNYDMYSWAYGMVDGVWEPTDFERTFVHPDTTSVYSTGLSSVQMLQNGNTLICSGRQGYSFELNPEGEVVWEYKTPLIGGAPASQGDSLTLNQNLTFRIKRYPPDYPAFEDKELISQGWIENNPDSMFCQLILPTNDVGMQYELSMFPNPANDVVVIDWQAGIYAEIAIFDLHGRPIHSFTASGGRKYLDVSDWVPGVYFVQVDGAMTKKLIIR